MKVKAPFTVSQVTSYLVVKNSHGQITQRISAREQANESRRSWARHCEIAAEREKNV